MSQHEVLQFLKGRWKKGSRKYYSIKELSKGIGHQAGTNCQKLRKCNLVEWEERKFKTKKGTYYDHYVHRWKP